MTQSLGVTNIDKTIQFNLDGKNWEKRLVLGPVEDLEKELNVASPVGAVLRSAAAGQELSVSVPGGDMVVRVLAIEEPDIE